MAKKGWTTEHERQLQLQSEGYHVVRCSGSIGALDLVCIKHIDIGFVVFYEQVKSTKDKTFYFNKQSRWELERLKEIESKFHIPCFFSIKFKRKGWKFINVKDIDGSPIKFMEKNNIK
jgi:Holliday junction resolvase